MALAKVSENDRKTIIWNFMEELWENYVNAMENNLPTKFNLLDFFSFGVLRDGFTENDKISVINNMQRKKVLSKLRELKYK